MKQIGDFLNGPAIPLAVVVIGIVLFVVLYCKENSRINKHRKEVQRKIIEEYEEKLKN